MKRRTYFLALSSVITVTAIIVLTLIQVRWVRSGPQVSTPTPPMDKPNSSGSVLAFRPTAIQPAIIDVVPNIPYDDKPSVVVQQPDGSRDRFLLAPDAVEAFINSLPKEDQYEGVIPPPSMLGNPQPPLSTVVP